MRKSAVFGVLVAVVGLFTLSVPGAGAQVSLGDLTIGGSPVRPGGSFTVSAAGCGGGGTTVLVGLLDADHASAIASAAVSPPPAGDWMVTVPVPPTTRPGTYPVTARCTNYLGYDGYAGTTPTTVVDETDWRFAGLTLADPYNGTYNGTDDGDGNGNGGGDGDGGDNGGGGTVSGPGSYEYPVASVIVLPPATVPDADGALTVNPSTIPVGGTARVTGDGWGADEQVTVTMYSTPVVLATAVTDANGAIDTQIRVPAGTTVGEHTVVAMNATSALHPARTLAATIRVTAEKAAVPTEVAGNTQTGSLAFTGSNLAILLLAAAALIAGGTYLSTRRNRPST